LELAPVLYAQMLKSLQYTMTVVLTWDFVEYWVAFERVLIDFGLEIVTIALDFSYREHTDLVNEIVGIMLLFCCIIQLEKIKCNEMMEQKHREQNIRNAFSRLVQKCVNDFAIKELKDILDVNGYFTVDVMKQYDFQLEIKFKVESHEKKQMTWDMSLDHIYRDNMKQVIMELKSKQNFN